jgi:hypothetical protein
LRFLVDMPVRPQTVAHLEAKGHDARAVRVSADEIFVLKGGRNGHGIFTDRTFPEAPPRRSTGSRTATNRPS